jgi:hypothetical protein
MTMRSLLHGTKTVVAIPPQTVNTAGSPTFTTSAGIDLQFFNSALVVGILGDIDELGGSPVGGAKMELVLEESDDNSTFTNVALTAVVGPTSVTSGVVASVTSDSTAGADPMEVAYVGDKRYIRVTLQGTSLTNGGPASVVVIKGHPRHGPQ